MLVRDAESEGDGRKAGDALTASELLLYPAALASFGQENAPLKRCSHA